MSTRSSDDEAFMMPGTAAARLGIHPQTLARWAKAGKIKFARTAGGHRRYSPAEIQRVKLGLAWAEVVAARGAQLPEDVPSCLRMDEDTPQAARR
jgi:excisionase family DNA binding protein